MTIIQRTGGRNFKHLDIIRHLNCSWSSVVLFGSRAGVVVNTYCKSLVTVKFFKRKEKNYNHLKCSIKAEKSNGR
jgi:hypothetical protein